MKKMIANLVIMILFIQTLKMKVKMMKRMLHLPENQHSS